MFLNFPTSRRVLRLTSPPSGACSLLPAQVSGCPLVRTLCKTTFFPYGKYRSFFCGVWGYHWGSTPLCFARAVSPPKTLLVTTRCVAPFVVFTDATISFVRGWAPLLKTPGSKCAGRWPFWAAKTAPQICWSSPWKAPSTSAQSTPCARTVLSWGSSLVLRPRDTHSSRSPKRRTYAERPFGGSSQRSRKRQEHGAEAPFFHKEVGYRNQHDHRRTC